MKTKRRFINSSSRGLGPGEGGLDGDESVLAVAADREAGGGGTGADPIAAAVEDPDIDAATELLLLLLEKGASAVALSA